MRSRRLINASTGHVSSEQPPLLLRCLFLNCLLLSSLNRCGQAIGVAVQAGDVVSILLAERGVRNSGEAIHTSDSKAGIDRSIQRGEVIDHRVAVAAIVVMHVKVDESRCLTVSLADLRRILIGVFAQTGKPIERDKEIILRENFFRKIETNIVRIADLNAVAQWAERFDVTGKTFHNPEMLVIRDSPRPRIQFVQNLVSCFVVNG